MRQAIHQQTGHRSHQQKPICMEIMQQISHLHKDINCEIMCTVEQRCYPGIHRCDSLSFGTNAFEQ